MLGLRLNPKNVVYIADTPTYVIERNPNPFERGGEKAWHMVRVKKILPGLYRLNPHASRAFWKTDPGPAGMLG